MRTSPHKHRVCAMLFPWFPLKFVRYFCYVMLCVLWPHKHRVCECFSLGLPFLKRLYSYVCHVLFCVFSLTNIGFVQCLSLGPLLTLYAYLCHVMLRVLRLTNISFVQCCSLGSLLSLHAYIGHVLMCVFFDLHGFCGIRLVNAGFVVVAGCFYSPGSACFMYLFLCFNICRFAFSCVICIQFGVLLFPFLLLP